MNFDLAGKTAVVTGASKGIGLSIVRALAQEGVQVVGVARTVSEELKAATPLFFSADLTDPQAPTRLMDYARDELGTLDLLVNNVGGTAGSEGGCLSLDDAAWQHTFDTTFYSAVRTTKAALPSLLERRGTIVNISSINARLPYPHLIDYSAAKAALSNLGKVLAEEFGPRGVRVNTISPGPVKTDIWTSPDGPAGVLARAQGVPLEEFLEQFPEVAGMSTGQFVVPDEVAKLVLLLASNAVPNMHGAELVIDGGLVKTL